MEGRVLQFNDLSRSLVAFDQNSTEIAAIELSLDKWLVGAIVPGITRDPLNPTLTVPEHIAGVADGRIVVISVCYAQATARPSEKP